MFDYGKIRSTVKPQALEIDEYSVYINTEISEIQTDFEGETVTEFEFNQVKYSKDEYIKMISDKNAVLENQLTYTQLALTEVYEMML